MDLVLTTSQKQILSQKMLQSTKILQMSSMELVEYVKELAVENPVVDYEEKTQDTEKFDLLRRKLDYLDASDEQNRTYYAEDKDEENTNDNWKFKSSGRESLPEYVISQINVLPISRGRIKLGDYMAQYLDGNGYFCGSVEEIARLFKIKTSCVDEVLGIIQGLEPAGVGARNLKECLLLQLKRQDIKNPVAEMIIEKELQTLGKNQMNQIARHLKVSINEVIEAVNIIKGLNPKPGSGFSGDETLEYITPDVIVLKKDEGYEIVLNDYFFPSISINGFYKNIIKSDNSTKDKEYVSNKIRQAEWAIKCISKRNTTLIKTIETIVDIQKEFFDRGPGSIKPMRLIDVASNIGVHESTVSRAIRDKYLQCSWGVFELSYFFGAGISSNDGADMVAADEVKQKIKELIDSEDKRAPLSDQKITQRLNDEGIGISRRTVAKYREAMEIPGISGRKEY